MFNTLKNLKEKYQNSNSWTELFLSYLPGMDDIYKRLGEAKTDKERIKILTEGLELSQAEIKRLMEENIRLKQEKEELQSYNQQKDLELAQLKKNQNLTELKTRLEKLKITIDSAVEIFHKK